MPRPKRDVPDEHEAALPADVWYYATMPAPFPRGWTFPPQWPALERMRHWQEWFELVSMERVERFFPELGLPVSDPDLLRSVARTFLVRFNEIDSVDASGSDELDRRLADLSELLDATRDSLRGRDGEKAFEGLERLVDQAERDQHESGAAFIWGHLLWPIAFRPEDIRTPLPFNGSLGQSIRDAVSRHLSPDFRLEEFGELEALPRSDWERTVYSWYEDDLSPIGRLSQFLANAAFRRLWADLETLLESGGIELLVDWAKREAEGHGMPPELVVPPGRVDA